jgi:hypothetical protein
MSGLDRSLPTEACGHLRTLDHRVPDFNDVRYAEKRHPYEHYYCAGTLQAYGPDDAPVCPEECTPARRCFVRSSRVARRP